MATLRSDKLPDFTLYLRPRCDPGNVVALDPLPRVVRFVESSHNPPRPCCHTVAPASQSDSVNLSIKHLGSPPLTTGILDVDSGGQGR